MTGVIKSNRCGTCRHRKIKCDEAKPICGPCKKGRRVCEAPISKVKFAKPKGLLPHHVHQLAYRNQQASTTPLALHRSLMQTKTENLQNLLFESFTANPGLRLATGASYQLEIPRRLGSSVALDDAVTCFLQRRQDLFFGSDEPDTRRQGRLYMKAVHSLNEAINDPVEGYSDNTLCAVVLLGEVELLGGGVPHTHGLGYIMHAGGAARLIQMRGADRHQQGFSKLLLAERRGAMIAEALHRGGDCFLSQEPWVEIDFSDLYSSHSESVIEEVTSVFLCVPTLLKEVHQMESFEALIDPQTVLSRAQGLRRTLQLMSPVIDEWFKNGQDVLEKPSMTHDEQFPFVYEFSHRSIAVACVFFWAVSTLLDKVIARLLPIAFPQAVSEALSLRCDRARHRICMSYEYSLRFWPLGSMYMAAPFIISYKGASETEKLWIMLRLWKLGEFIPKTKIFWGPLGLEVLTELFTGGWSPDLSLARAITEMRDGEDARELTET